MIRELITVVVHICMARAVRIRIVRVVHWCVELPWAGIIKSVITHLYHSFPNTTQLTDSVLYNILNMEECEKNIDAEAVIMGRPMARGSLVRG